MSERDIAMPAFRRMTSNTMPDKHFRSADDLLGFVDVDFLDADPIRVRCGQVGHASTVGAAGLCVRPQRQHPPA